MSDIHPKTPTEITLELFKKRKHPTVERLIEGDLYHSVIDAIEKEQKLTDNWVETARQHYRNEEYYQGLLTKIGEIIGKEAYIRDDGTISENVLRAKLPDLVEKIIQQLGQEKCAEGTCHYYG